MHGQIPLKRRFVLQIAKASTYCCCYVQLHVALRKRNNMLHSPFAFKQTVKISFFSLVLFSDSYSWEFWPQLSCDYESFAFLVYG